MTASPRLAEAATFRVEIVAGIGLRGVCSAAAAPADLVPCLRAEVDASVSRLIDVESADQAVLESGFGGSCAGATTANPLAACEQAEHVGEVSRLLTLLP